jgi:hypothetical protein
MNLTRNNKQTGTALVVVISIMATLAVLVYTAAEYTATINRLVVRSNTLENAITVGDASTEIMFSYWREVCRTNTNYPAPTSWFQNLPLPTQSQFPNVPNFSATAGAYSAAYTVSNCKVVAVDPQLNPIDSNLTPPPGIGQNATSATYNYVASADVTLPLQNGNIVTKVRRVFQKQQLSPWNYAIFYVDPLEIQPGPTLNITGWVHTNSDLFTGHNTLHFLDKVTYASDWTTGFKPGDPRAVGGSAPETPTIPSWLSNLPPALDIAHQPFGLDSSRIFSTADSNPNNDSYRELIQPPVAGYTDALAGQRYYDQAGVRILVDNSNNVTIKNSSDVTVNGSSTGANLKLYQTFSTALTTNQTIQDYREQASVRLATLNVATVLSKINDGTLQNFNGIIYFTDTSAAANGVGAKRGLRVKNGTVLPTGGLTIVSNNPIYVQGDYNTGGSNPPSNSGNPSSPQVSGYTRQPSAIIGDAVNLLSNAWNDANSNAGLGSRVASNTTVNAAILSGIVPSANENYSGGAENFPRFLEDWSNKTLTYYGSMVELYVSQQSIGAWGKQNVYNPPTRQWYFDTNFRVIPPPGSLMVYSYVKGKWSIVQ